MTQGMTVICESQTDCLYFRSVTQCVRCTVTVRVPQEIPCRGAQSLIAIAVRVFRANVTPSNYQLSAFALGFVMYLVTSISSHHKWPITFKFPSLNVASVIENNISCSFSFNFPSGGVVIVMMGKVKVKVKQSHYRP
jgi:hypothetical protein